MDCWAKAFVTGKWPISYLAVVYNVIFLLEFSDVNMHNNDS